MEELRGAAFRYHTEMGSCGRLLDRSSEAITVIQRNAQEEERTDRSIWQG